MYAGVEALRYQVTRDPAALVAMERALWGLHGLARDRCQPGLITRNFGDPKTQTDGIIQPFGPTRACATSSRTCPATSTRAGSTAWP